jgi:hypothetical protein
MDAWGYCAHLRANKLNHQPFCLSGFATVEILGGLLRARLGHWTAIDGLIRPLICAEIAIVCIAAKLFILPLNCFVVVLGATGEPRPAWGVMARC